MKLQLYKIIKGKQQIEPSIRVNLNTYHHEKCLHNFTWLFSTPGFQRNFLFIKDIINAPIHLGVSHQNNTLSAATNINEAPAQENRLQSWTIMLIHFRTTYTFKLTTNFVILMTLFLSQVPPPSPQTMLKNVSLTSICLQH